MEIFGFMQRIQKEIEDMFLLMQLEKELLDLNFVRTEWWLGWKYIYNPKNLNQTLNFKEMNKELALLLNNDDELENLISKIEKEIIEKLEILFEE